VESQKSFSSVATSNSFLKLMYKLSSHCSLHSPLLKQSVSLGFRSFLLVIVSIMKSRSSISYRKLSSREEEQKSHKEAPGASSIAWTGSMQHEVAWLRMDLRSPLRPWNPSAGENGWPAQESSSPSAMMQKTIRPEQWCVTGWTVPTAGRQVRSHSC
jgi:hypothetical protein